MKETMRCGGENYDLFFLTIQDGLKPLAYPNEISIKKSENQATKKNNFKNTTHYNIEISSLKIFVIFGSAIAAVAIISSKLTGFNSSGKPSSVKTDIANTGKLM